MRRFRYVIVDVSTGTPLAGNQLAVFTTRATFRTASSSGARGGRRDSSGGAQPAADQAVEYASSPTNTEGDPSNAIFAQKPGGSDAPQAKGDD